METQTIAEIASSWRSLVTSPWPWHRAPHQAGALLGPIVEGEAGGFYVTSDVVPRRAYLKPLKKDPGPFRSRAAREKIVSDLAHDLGVAVPPVILYERPDGADESHCCVSLVVHATQFSWELAKQFVVEADDAIGKPLIAALPVASAQVIALNTWVMQGDHDDHPNNIVVGYDDGVTPRFVFLDYALALGHVWASGNSSLHQLGWRRWDSEGGAQASVTGTAPPLMWRYASRDELEASVRKIELFPERTIRDVVGRIPSPYMERAERDTVATGLIARRAIVRQVLDRTLKGTQ